MNTSNFTIHNLFRVELAFAKLIFIFRSFYQPIPQLLIFNYRSLMESMQQQKRDYGSARAYTEEVQKWAQSVRCWMAYQQMCNAAYALQFQHQHSAVMSSQQNNQQAQQGQANGNRLTVRLNLSRIFRSAGAMQGVPQTIIVQQHVIPSFLRRVAAEAIDSCLFFLFKLIIVYMLVEFDIIELEQFEKILTNESDIQTLIDVTQELFYIELVCKMFTALAEALFTAYGLGSLPPGCTPGKYVMRLRVISCLDVQPVVGNNDAERVAVTSLPAVPFKNALLRSLLKNLLTSFLFPLSTAFYVFSYNRAIYDLGAKTIVVNL